MADTTVVVKEVEVEVVKMAEMVAVIFWVVEMVPVDLGRGEGVVLVPVEMGLVAVVVMVREEVVVVAEV